MTSSLLRKLLVLLALANPLVAEAQDLMKGGTHENPKSRRQHFYHVRSYPFGRIPQGARLKAIEDAETRVESYRSKAGGLHALNQWRLIGPSDVGGRINAIAVHPTDGQTLWAG